MYLVSFIALSLSLPLALASTLPEREVLSLPLADSGLASRAVAGLTFCTGTNFGGQCNAYSPTTGTCYSVPDPYTTSLFSSFTSPGYVCFLYRDAACSSCEACVDSEGWTNMGSFAAVYSLRCAIADSAGCSNANCVHH